MNIVRILKLAKSLHKPLLLLVFLILLVAVINQIAPILSKFIVDEIVVQINSNNGDFIQVLWLVAASFVIALVGIIISSISERLGDHFSGELNRFLADKFYSKVLTYPQIFFDGQISGKILNQLTRGIRAIQDFVNASSNFMLPLIMQSVVTIGILLFYNLWIGLAIASLYPIYFLLTKKSADTWGKYQIEKNKIEDRSRGRIQEVVTNIKLVKVFNRLTDEISLNDKLQENINKVYAKQSNNFHIYDFIRNFCLEVVVIIIYLIVFYNTFLGNLTIGDLFLIVQLVNSSRRPLMSMSFLLSRFQNAESDAAEYLEILNYDYAEDIDLNIDAKDLQLLEKPQLEFKNVSFSYGRERQKYLKHDYDDSSDLVFDDLSLKFAEAETVALVGKSGAGKSTLVNMILGLYRPQKGNLLINGMNYQEFGLANLRANISLVFQDSELFSGTVRENVAYGLHKDVDEDKIIAVLQDAYAWEFVQKLSKGLDTEIGERGVRLSGGQKQRLQIARALLIDAPILILDEATSSLDAKSELMVQNSLEKLMKHKLVIVIAHRFSTIQDADRIVVLENGRVSMDGTPQELSQQPGLYADLLRYQIEGNKKLLTNYELF